MDVCSSWATSDDMVELPDSLKLSDGEVETALLNATGILYRLTGSRWPGACTDVIRPQSRGCGCTRERPGCHWLSEFQLPGFPVVSVSEVLMDGALVPEDRYRIDDQRWLVYLPDPTDERQGWPCCQRMDRDTDQDDTWRVTYVWGSGPAQGGVQAAASLARELILATRAGSGCRLPTRVQNVTRQGVSWVLLDDLSMFAEGRTGLADVDLWLGSVIQGAKRRRSGIIDPHAVAMAGRRVRRTDWNPSS